jgi:hypothetical protein
MTVWNINNPTNGARRANLHIGSFRSVFVIALLLLTADRLPAPVSELPESPKLKRTFFTLEGSAVDTFTNEKKLPGEVDPAFEGAVHVLATPTLKELTELMKKFGRRFASPPDALSSGFEALEDQDLTPEMRRREAAIQRIAESQLKKIAAAAYLPMARGAGTSCLASELPSEFFKNHPWDLDSPGFEELQISGVKRPSQDRIEVPINTLGGNLIRFATRADVELLRGIDKSSFKDSSGMGFYADISRTSMPERLFQIKVWYEECGGSGTTVSMYAPSLQLRLLVLENVSKAPILLGQFHFRLVSPGRGVLAVRTRSENDRLVALTRTDSQFWYGPRVLKPGEKVIVPLELLLKRHRENRSESLGTTRAARRGYANQLLADRELKTVAIMYEGKQRVEEGMSSEQSKSTPLLVMPKQRFIEMLRGESVRASESDEFLYGPAISLDAVDVDGPKYAIQPLDPTNIAYFSGYAEGSCPFAYCRRAGDDVWLKQGSILKGHSSKAREGTTVLVVRDFNGTVRISEEEDETSYVDQLFIRGTSSTGGTVIVPPTDDLLAHKDHRYLVLTKGKTTEVRFRIPEGMRRDRVEVVASGYFVPTSAKNSR